jgi:hypothetical protein
MDGMTLLGQARFAGVSVSADGDRLHLEGPRRVEPIMRQLAEHKAAVLDALAVETALGIAISIIDPDALPGDWRIEFEERAAVREHDGKQLREHAEAAALGEVLNRMRAADQFPSPRYLQ